MLSVPGVVQPWGGPSSSGGIESPSRPCTLPALMANFCKALVTLGCNVLEMTTPNSGPGETQVKATWDREELEGLSQQRVVSSRGAREDEASSLQENLNSPHVPSK